MLSGLRMRCSLGRSVLAKVCCIESVVCLTIMTREEGTYHLVVLLANLLARELAHPVVATVVGHDTWDYERHVCSCESLCLFGEDESKNRVDR
jgi:hypothetical protein